MKSEIKPIFNKWIFRDVDFEKLDYDTNANFVIERVFERGDVEDIRNYRRYYEDEKVSEALLNTKFQSQITIYLASAVINHPLEGFRCFKLRQSHPELFPY